MRLSDAIRLGSMLKPQTAGERWSGDSSCAIGAAFDAIGRNGDRLTPVADVFALDVSRAVECPACQSFSDTPNIIITHLNDSHEWTREAIADWIEQYEPSAVETTVLSASAAT